MPRIGEKIPVYKRPFTLDRLSSKESLIRGHFSRSLARRLCHADEPQ